MSGWLAGLVTVALLVLNGFFVAAEFALLAARRSRVEQLASEGNRQAVAALRGVRELSLMLAGAQLGITMASLGLGAVAEPALAHLLEELLGLAAVPAGLRHALAFTVALAVVVFLHMVVGEMAPKSWAISNPEQSALRLARPFRGFVLVFRPFIHALNWSANAIVRLLGVEPQEGLAQVHRPSDLLLLVQESAEHGSIGEEQHALLTRALDLSGLDAKAAMVPRSDIVAVSAEASVAELEAVASRTGRSRLPVYSGDLDHILGILHVKDLLDLDAAADITAADLARPALVVPESRPLEDLMLDMREQRQHVAIVVDEFGAVEGLVALEDCLEELIGDFEDETDRRATLRQRLDGTVVVPGSMRPDELAGRSGLTLPEGPWETVAGFVIAALDRLPDVGDAVEHDGALLRVSKMDGYRVVEITVIPPAPQ